MVVCRAANARLGQGTREFLGHPGKQMFFFHLRVMVEAEWEWDGHGVDYTVLPTLSYLDLMLLREYSNAVSLQQPAPHLASARICSDCMLTMWEEEVVVVAVVEGSETIHAMVVEDLVSIATDAIPAAEELGSDDMLPEDNAGEVVIRTFLHSSAYLWMRD
jgi:hypothetical protein